jgi:hypothetical protein
MNFDREAVIEKIKRGFEEVKSCRASKYHHEIWKHILTGRWFEALHMTQDDFGLQTVRGLTWLLINHYESFRSRNPKRATEYLKELFSELETYAEDGIVLRLELEQVALEWGLMSEEETMKKNLYRKSVGRAMRNHEDFITVKEGAAVKRISVDEIEHENSDKDDSIRAPKTPPRPPRAYVVYPEQYKPHALNKREERLRQEIPAPPVPVDPKTWMTSGDLRASWIQWIDAIARRYPAPLSPKELQRISGAPVRFCNSMFKEWRAMLQNGIGDNDRRALAIALSAEAEAVAREAMLLATNTEDDRVQMAGLKLALDAIGKRTDLLGLDKIDLAPPVEMKGLTWQEQAIEAGLTEEDLKAIGDIASKALSRK